MDEIKRRTAVITDVLSGKWSLMPMKVAEEICYLQLRMICELIALASLVVHGDIEVTRTGKMRKQYHADWIMSALEKVHPKFYPRPTRQIVTAPGKYKLDEVTSDYLTRKDLATLYAECGSNLHRGTVDAVLFRRSRPVDLPRIAMWRDKIIKLLNHHNIDLLGKPDKMYVILMQAISDGKVHATTFVRIGDAPPA